MRKAIGLALFGMELHADQIVARHRRDQPAAVVGHRRHVMAVLGHEVIGMQEIGLAGFDQRGVGGGDHVVPAHVGDLDRGVGPLDQPHLAADPAQSRGDAVLHAAIRQQLHAHADAQERRTADQHPFGHRLDHVRDRAQAIGAGAEAADAGQDDPVGRADDFGIGGQGDVFSPGGLQGIGDRMQIARAVIDQGQNFSHRAGPWLTGPPRPCADQAPPRCASPGQSP